MIKCNVKVCGTISKDAVVRKNKEGKPFTAFSMSCVIPGNNCNDRKVEVSVAIDGEADDIRDYTVGNRIEVAGVLTFKKRLDNIFFNLSASSVDLYVESGEDSISGEMHFRGKTGKKIDVKTGKNGKKFLLFSAFSTEKVNDGFEYLWVRFIGFDREREEWLQPQTSVEVKGDLELSVFCDRLDIACKVTEISEYVKPAYNPNR